MASISVELPPELFERLREAAAQREQSVEAALIDSLNRSFAVPVTDDLSLLETLADDILIQIMKQRLSDADAERMEVLLDKGNQGTLSNAEKPELDRLVDQVNLHMLLRSKALLILKQRGHDDNALHQYLT